MAERAPESAVTKRVKYAIGGIEHLAVLPAMATTAIAAVTQGSFSPAGLASVVEISPGLAARVLSLAWQEGIDLEELGFSIQRIIEKIPVERWRDLILSCEIYRTDQGDVTEGGPSRQELVLHSLAVAYGARRIAEASPLQIHPDLAYLAGLLHDMGKLALQQVMPRGFDRIVQLARSSGEAGHVVERQELGTDHAALGRLLAQQWHLPQSVETAIWLHHSPAATASLSDGGTLAQLVTVADTLVRAAGIGPSGSFDRPRVTPSMAEWLDVEYAALQAMADRFPEVVQQMKTRLAWEDTDPWRRLSEVTRMAALQMNRQYTQWTTEQRKLQGISNQMAFLRDILAALPRHLAAVDLAEEMARRWQHYYQTGKVCILLSSSEEDDVLDVAIAEGLGASRVLLLEGMEPLEEIAEVAGKDFGVYPAGPFLDGLAEQTGTEWDRHRTWWVPLTFGRHAFGRIVFELNYPADADRFVEHFQFTTLMVGAGLALLMSRQRHEQIAESLAGLLSEATVTGPDADPMDLTEALIEVAAGFAHELNNPLAVISGRAQLLADEPMDESTHRSLYQIQEQARQVTALVEGLMSFAEPPPPRKAPTALGQILDEAVELVKQRLRDSDLDLHVETAQDVTAVFVDSAQVATAVFNVLVNAFESYVEAHGRVEVRIDRDPLGERAVIRVRDHGCGMDAPTLRKAILPFFSAKPAGRKRGLGLAFADRLIRLNGGHLQISSEPGAGSTVTLELPLQGPS